MCIVQRASQVLSHSPPNPRIAAFGALESIFIIIYIYYTFWKFVFIIVYFNYYHNYWQESDVHPPHSLPNPRMEK